MTILVNSNSFFFDEFWLVWNVCYIKMFFLWKYSLRFLKQNLLISIAIYIEILQPSSISYSSIFIYHQIMPKIDMLM